MSIEKTAQAHIDALMENHPKGFDLSLDRITGLLKKLGDPQDKLPPVIHVAGTNGKGSVIALTRAILEAAGLSVHVHTSPHLVNWHERYRIGKKGKPGELVSDPMLAEAIARVAAANGGQPITVFEVLTVVTFLLFSEQPADVALIEVGLGGRFDATNVMKKVAVSTITPVSIDHEAYLGDTFAKIAFEKAGIIKPKTPVVIGPQHDDALAVIEKQAALNHSRTLVYGQDYFASRERGRLVYQDDQRLLDLNLPSLQGEHQINNAAVAIATSLQFCQDRAITLSDAMIDTGLKSTDWPGRMQRLRSGKLFEHVPQNSEIWLDGGHNPGAAEMVAAFMATLQNSNPRPLVLICGMLNTKDLSGYFKQLTGIIDEVITVPILSSDAGIEPAELAETAQKFGLSAISAPSLRVALEKIKPDPAPRILIAGSLYLVGDALAQNATPPV